MNLLYRLEPILAWVERNFRTILITAILWLVTFLALGPVLGMVPAANATQSREFVGALVLLIVVFVGWRLVMQYQLGKDKKNSLTEERVASLTKRILGVSMLVMMVIGSGVFINLAFF